MGNLLAEPTIFVEKKNWEKSQAIIGNRPVAKRFVFQLVPHLAEFFFSFYLVTFQKTSGINIVKTDIYPNESQEARYERDISARKIVL